MVQLTIANALVWLDLNLAIAVDHIVLIVADVKSGPRGLVLPSMSK